MVGGGRRRARLSLPDGAILPVRQRLQQPGCEGQGLGPRWVCRLIPRPELQGPEDVLDPVPTGGKEDTSTGHE